jgi:hypothetical protein
VHLICILNSQSENAKHHKYATGVELQGHGNLFIWHGQIWKWEYLSPNKELSLSLSLSSLFPAPFLPFCLENERQRKDTEPKPSRNTMKWEATRDLEGVVAMTTNAWRTQGEHLLGTVRLHLSSTA